MRGLALLLTLASAAHAQRQLTLDDALMLARLQSRDLAAARARLDQQATAVTQAYAALLPTAAVQGRYTHNYKEITLSVSGDPALLALVDVLKATSGSSLQNGALNAFEQQYTNAINSAPSFVLQKAEQLDFVASVTLPLIVPWAYPALQGAKKNYAGWIANYRATEAQILLGVAASFFAAAGTDALLTARRHAIEVAKQTVDNAQARFESGVVNRVEVTRAELALVRAEQAARETDDLRFSTYRTLATAIGLNEPFVVISTAEPAAPPQSGRELAELALKLRPEFVTFARSDEALAAQVSSSRWRWAPTVSGFGNVRAFNYPGFAGDNYSWALGLQLDWVVYDGGIRDVAATLARAQRRENEQRWLALKAVVIDDVEVARRALGTKRQALQAARRSVDLSKETLDLVRVQHDAGTATQLDLLQAQDALVGAEVAVAQARFDLDLSTLQLQQKAGLFPTSDK